MDSTPAPDNLRRHRNLAQQLTAEVAAQIHAGLLQPGDQLPTEAAMMQLHGVSRTVVREAISRLKAKALVESRHGIGNFVLAQRAPLGLHGGPATSASLEDVLAMLELRIGVEVEAAGLAATRRSAAQLQRMGELLALLTGTRALDSTLADFQFHLQIAEASGNAYFCDILGHLGGGIIPRSRLDARRLQHVGQPQYQYRLNREHEDIYDAIARGDAQMARAAMRLHLSNSRERFQGHLQALPGVEQA